MIEIRAEVASDQFDPAVRCLRDAGFELRMIMPADDPSLALLEADGMSLRLHGGETRWPAGLTVPPVVPEFELSRFADSGWGEGRAGMLYRDLLPSRQGGRFIASHIRIPDAGPVPDHVHFHKISFQLIFCVAGWVRLVYEGQGEPFVLAAGDCVLQPPEIRHRVLESSGGLEVVELACPAVHETWFDAAMTLPTAKPVAVFGGQRFVHHRADAATWAPWRADGFVCRDTGIGEATGATAGVRVVRAGAGARAAPVAHDGELQFWFVLDGEAAVERDGEPTVPLRPADAVAIPAGMRHAIAARGAGFELLEVTAPAHLGFE